MRHLKLFHLDIRTTSGLLVLEFSQTFGLKTEIEGCIVTDNRLCNCVYPNNIFVYQFNQRFCLLALAVATVSS